MQRERIRQKTKVKNISILFGAKNPRIAYAHSHARTYVQPFLLMPNLPSLPPTPSNHNH
jgi:hypothetical protein